MRIQFKKIVIVFLAVSSLGTGCGESDSKYEELAVNPNQLSLNGFYDTPEGVNAGVIGIYHYVTNPRSFGSQGKGMWGHHRTDEMSTGADFGISGQHNSRLSPSFYTIQQPWSMLYTASLQASTVIENIDSADFSGDTQTRDAYLGEAHMLRAFAHYFLLVNYRNIPILDSVPASGEFNKPQSPPDQVWDFIISDLQTAKGLLPPKAFWGSQWAGRMTSGAAAGLLGKVYLLRSGIENVDFYSEAAAEFDELISGVHGPYALTVDYRHNFTIDRENNIESVLELQFFGDGDENTGFNPGQVTTGLFSDARAWAPPGLRGASWASAVVHDWVYDAFVASVDLDGMTDRRMFGTLVFDDLAPGINIPDLNNDGDFTNDRLELNAGATFEEVYFEDGTFAGKDIDAAAYRASNWKWLDWNLQLEGNQSSNDDRFRSSRAHGANLRMIRYADVLLMYAESVIMGGAQGSITPLEAVNQVRARANVPALGSVTMAEIRTERILELTNEGTRGLDLLRWGDLVTRMQDLETTDPLFKQYDTGTYIQFETPKNLYLPIPIDEISSNPEINIQNPGW